MTKGTQIHFRLCSGTCEGANPLLPGFPNNIYQWLWESFFSFPHARPQQWKAVAIVTLMLLLGRTVPPLRKKKLGLKWNISTEMARAGERYLLCVVKANTCKDQFSIGANKMSRLWHSVLLLPPSYFFYFLTTQAVLAKRPKGQEHHLWYPIPTDVNGLSQGESAGITLGPQFSSGRVC